MNRRDQYRTVRGLCIARSRPSPLASVFFVFVGGFVGTLARFGTSVALPPIGEWPTATFAVNVVGSFALAFVLGHIGVRSGGGVVSPSVQRLRLLFGTGVISGFSTYSTFAMETDLLLAGGRTDGAVGYAIASTVAGLASAACGLRTARVRAAGLQVLEEDVA